VTLSDLSIERPVLTWMLMLGLVVFGLLGYLRLGVDQYPDMEFPEVAVVARLDGATPEVMEQDVTDVLEEYLSTVSGVRTLRSTSYAGISNIGVEFELGVDLDTAIQDVRDQVAAARNRLPIDVEPPAVSRIRIGSYPVVYVPFMLDEARASLRSLVELSEYVRYEVKPLLENIPGVAGVSLSGRRDRNVRIWLDSDALRARGLAASDVIAALRREHVEVPGGLVEGPRLEWTVKTEAEFTSIERMQELVVAQQGDAAILLRDVARVEDGEADLRALTRYNGRSAVVAGVSKQSDANTVAVVDEVRRRIDALRPLLPDGVEVVDSEQFVDFSMSIRESVAETQFALAFGGLLAVFVVFVFLRRVRPTLIVATAIPLSLITTFGLVWMAGHTLNTMTLLGMTLAIGVVIDDAIIVLENIERHREMGKSARRAASEGTRQITFAATAATFSVAAVFLPVVFAEGIVGNFLGEFGLTVAGSVIVSLFVALTLTPMLAARMPPPEPRPEGGLYQRLERAFAALERGYAWLLELSLSQRLLTALLAVASLGLAVFFGSRLGSEFFPATDGRIAFLQFETPPGTSLEATTEILERNEEYFLALPERLALFEGIGNTSAVEVGRSNRGGIFVTLVPSHQRRRSSQEIMREARAFASGIAGQKSTIGDPSASFSVEGEFQMQLRGNVPIAELDAHARELMRRLQARGGFVDLDKDLKVGSPELRVIPDRKKAASLGVDGTSLAQVVQVMIGGLDVGIFKSGGRRHDIRMRLEPEDRASPDDIQGLSVRSRSGEIVDLRNLIRIETGAAPSAISRTNRQRSVTVSANLEGKDLGAAVREATAIGREILPDGVRLELAGQAEVMRQSASQLAQMLILAVLVIYMGLAAQFESFVLPLSVMLALPFSMVGALGALSAAGMTLNLFSLIGIVLLMGLVTKNSILLVDYANQLRDEGLTALEAMRRAAPVRMRPVLMTAVSMIFGVLPAAFGIGPGAETRAPMAVATAAGMFSSMLLTLLVVPVFYVLLEGIAERGRRLIGARRRPQRLAEDSSGV